MLISSVSMLVTSPGACRIISRLQTRVEKAHDFSVAKLCAHPAADRSRGLDCKLLARVLTNRSWRARRRRAGRRSLLIHPATMRGGLPALIKSTASPIASTPSGKYFVEVKRTGGVVGFDLHFFLQQDGPVSIPRSTQKRAQPGDGFAVDQSPIDGAGAAIFGQERRMKTDAA